VETFQFKQAKQYMFFYEDTQVLLLVWERDQTKMLFIVLDQLPDGTYVIDYPGSLFTERLMELVDSIFFIQVQEQERSERYAMGAYFQEGDLWFGAYYPRVEQEGAGNVPEIVFFKVDDTEGMLQLKELEHDEHQVAIQAFLKRYQDILHIQA
jgi:hypothetical protein